MSEREAKQHRLAEALRDNLKKRKQQERARESLPISGDKSENPDTEA